MIAMSLDAIAEAVGGKIVQGEGLSFHAVSTDTRKVNAGDLFVALKGEKFDGHEFVFQAIAAGATGLVVSKVVEAYPPGVGVIKVENTLQALQMLARTQRRFKAIPIVAITGSAGKTSTKDLIAAVLAEKLKVLKTEGNFNNEIGLPLTIFRLEDMHEVMVVEMGMRGQGQIAELVSIAEPTIGVITNIGEAHIELLGSKENISKAKGELIEGLPANGTAILNGDDPYLRDIGSKAAARGLKVLFYGHTGNNNLRVIDQESQGLEGTRLTVALGQQEFSYTLPILGEYNVLNSLAAILVALELDLELTQIVEGLKKVKLSSMRLEVKNSIAGYQIIDDTYNANPTAMLGALKTLSQLPATGRRVAVLGSMFELGEEAISGHKRVGEAAAELSIDMLFTIGDLAQDIANGFIEAGGNKRSCYAFVNKQEAIGELKKVLQKNDIILIKGSRGMGLEDVVKAIQ